MNIKKYIQTESKSWLIAILLLFVMLFFGKSLEYVKSITDLNSIFLIGQILLIIVFGLSFLFYTIYADGLEHNEKLEFREYETEDIKRLKRNLKKMLVIFSVSSILWIIGNAIIGIEYRNSENLKYLIAIIIVPLIVNGIMIYIYKGIKTAYNTV